MSRVLNRALPALLAALACGALQAAEPAPLRFRDPALPPAAARAVPRPAPAASGAALRAQVERLIEADFAAADRAHRGRLTRAEAQAGGFGFVVRHFDEIDLARRGSVSVDDLQRYLRRRAAGG